MIVRESDRFEEISIMEDLMHKEIASRPGVILARTEKNPPHKANHYVWEREVLFNGREKAYIEVHHFGVPLPIAFMIPTIIGLRTFEGEKFKSADFFTIDKRGNILAHTNIQLNVNGEEILSSDNSLGNLYKFKELLYSQSYDKGLNLQAQERINHAFENHEFEVEKERAKHAWES